MTEFNDRFTFASMPDLIHSKLKAAVELGTSDPKRDIRIFIASQLFVAATGEIEEGMSLYNQYALEQL